MLVLGLVSLCTDVSSEMLQPVRFLFLVYTLGTPVVIAGTIEGFASNTLKLSKNRKKRDVLLWCCCRPRQRANDALQVVDRGLHHRLLGHRPGDRLQRAHRRRVRRDGARPTSRCRPRCSKSRSCAARAACSTRSSSANTRGDGREGLPARQDARDAPAPPASTRTRPTRSSPTARKARAACATCRS